MVPVVSTSSASSHKRSICDTFNKSAAESVTARQRQAGAPQLQLPSGGHLHGNSFLEMVGVSGGVGTSFLSVKAFYRAAQPT